MSFRALVLDRPGTVPAALAVVARGGRVVCAGIHMSAIPSFPYDLLWGERSISSVANLTRADGDAFFALAAEAPLRSTGYARATSAARRCSRCAERGSGR